MSLQQADVLYNSWATPHSTEIRHALNELTASRRTASWATPHATEIGNVLTEPRHDLTELRYALTELRNILTELRRTIPISAAP